MGDALMGYTSKQYGSIWGGRGRGTIRGRPTPPVPKALPWGVPPPGSYDPALDAGVDAANRGLFDLGQDTQTQRERLTTDYGLQTGDVTRQRDRSLADLGTAQTNATADHQRSLDMLQRSYTQLAGRQQQGQARAGVLSGGAVLQAAAKRAENQQIDQAPIDTSYKRFTDANTLAQGRVGQDAESALGRLALTMAPPGAGGPLGGRAFQDVGTGITRAQRENTAFGVDTAAQRAWQASGQGWEPGPRPRRRRR